MGDILQDIIVRKRQELEVLYAPKPSLRGALLNSSTGIIAEFKRRSPSKGWIREDGRADLIPLSYERNGAAAVSILTDGHFFGGADEYVSVARQSGLSVPVLYKNFVIDEAQLYAATLCGASAVLLIAACLSKIRCRQLMERAHELGLEVLLEMHSERELEYADLEPDLCGINNRNLGSFVTDVENSFRLAELLPQDAVKVSESGLADPVTVKALRAAGFRGFLMGEHFMRAADPGDALRRFMSSLSLVKVCGMREAENIREVEALGVDMMGFLFWPKSNRYVKELPGYLPRKAKRVGVFVDEDIECVRKRADEYQLDFVQLHGKESPEYCAQLEGCRLIKAFNIATVDDLVPCKAYASVVDYFLFDTRGSSIGGNGEKFDWDVLSAYNGSTPFFLSGGIGPEDAERVKAFSHPMCIGIDLNSRFEIVPGLKDVTKLNDFIGSI